MVGPTQVDAPSNEVQPRSALPQALTTAQAFTVGTSDKYVPMPSAEDILTDQIEMLKDFRGRTRSRADQVKLRERTRNEKEIRRSSNQPTSLPTPGNEGDDGNSTNFWHENNPEPPELKGMKTGLYDKLKGRTDKPSDHSTLESFLTDFEKILSGQFQSKILGKDTRKISEFDKQLMKAVAALRHEKDWLLCPTNKTNRWEPVRTANCIAWMNSHLEPAHGDN